MSSIPAVPLDMVDAIRVVESDIDNAMVKVAERHGTKKVSMSMIIDYFFQQCGFPTTDWNFCDALFVRYFTKVAESLYVGKAFSTHAACFLACVCLVDREALVQLVIDVYSDCEDGASISLGRCRLLIENLLDLKGGNCQRYSAEAYEKFLSYARANPTATITVNVPDVSAMEEDEEGGGPPGSGYVFYSEDHHTVPTRVMLAFFAKKHRFIFWPLDMLQAQLQRVFMGEDFWGTLKTSAFYLYLQGKGVTADTYWFAEVLQKMYITSLNKMKAMGTLSAVPFDRKPENPVTPRSRKTKRKLPPEAYAIKKKVEAPMESMAEIKESVANRDGVNANDAGMVNPDGTVKTRSSKSSKSVKSSGPSPLSGKYNSFESLDPYPPEPVPEPVAETPTAWKAITQIFTNIAKPNGSSPKSPKSAVSNESKAAPAQAVAESKVFLPSLLIPDSSTSSTESGAANGKSPSSSPRRKSTGANTTNSCGESNKKEKPLSPGRQLFSTFSTFMTASSTSPKKATLPHLTSRDDNCKTNGAAGSHETPTMKSHSAVNLRPLSPRDSSTSAPSSPRDRRRSEKYTDLGGHERKISAKLSESGKSIDSSAIDSNIVASPRRSVKLAKISSKNDLGKV